MKKLEVCQAVWRLGLTLIMLGLISCAGSRTAPTGETDANGLTQPNSPQLTQAERMQLARNFRRALPPHAYAALESLGAPAVPAASSDARSTSVDLPHSFTADAPYSSGGAGWMAHSFDAVIPAPGPEGGAALAPPNSSFPNNFSYVIYRVDNVNQALGTLTMSFGIGLPADFGVGAYNWDYGTHGRWEPLYYGSSQFGAVDVPLNVPNADFSNSGNDLAFVVFCLNPAQLTVTNFTLGEPITGDPPLAQLATSPGHGPAPLTVTLDGSFSTDDDGSIVNYRFDPLGDGNWIDNGDVPTFEFEYTTPGAYHPQLEVTDDDGLAAVDVTTVIASPLVFDETEDNDEEGQADELPALPFASFTGNVGFGGSYDGDMGDYFTFSAAAGDEVNFLVDFSPANGFISAELSHAGGVLATSNLYPPQPLTHAFNGSEIEPFVLRVFTATEFSGESDYVIVARDIIYDELENNDTAQDAQFLGPLQLEQELTDFDASLGSSESYVGYDGDRSDWFYFDAAEGATLELTATYNGATGDVGVTLFDSGANPLANSASGDGFEELSYTFGPSDNGPFLLHCADPNGYSDYVLDATLDPPSGGGYDEKENNDDYAGAQQFPEIAFDNFTGNIGAGGDNDGDIEDFYSFSANPGDIVKFTIAPSVPDQFIGADIYDSSTPSRRWIGTSNRNSVTGVVEAIAIIRDFYVAPYVLKLAVSEFTVPGDYSIDGALSTYMEVENNDDFAQANVLPEGWFGIFIGSIGSNGYDGDDKDVFSFTIADNEQPIYYINYDPDGGDTGLTGFMRDSDGFEIAWDQSDDGGLELRAETGFEQGETYYVEVLADKGGSSYWLQKSQW